MLAEPPPHQDQSAAGRNASEVGCLALVAGAATISIGYLMLCALLYGSRSDPFGLFALTSLTVIGVGLLMLVPATLVGLAERLRRRQWILATLAVCSVAGAAVLGAVAIGWLGEPSIRNSEWVLPAITTLAIAAAAMAVGRNGRATEIAVIAVTLAGGLFGWAIASRLDVRIVK